MIRQRNSRKLCIMRTSTVPLQTLLDLCTLRHRNISHILQDLPQCLVALYTSLLYEK
jgi:hypothetical protein